MGYPMSFLEASLDPCSKSWPALPALSPFSPIDIDRHHGLMALWTLGFPSHFPFTEVFFNKPIDDLAAAWRTWTGASLTEGFRMPGQQPALLSSLRVRPAWTLLTLP